MVYIYCRVSTRKQDKNFSFPEQKKRGIAFAESLSQPYVLYPEIVSGTTKGLGKRTEWLKLIDNLQKAQEGDIIWYGNDTRLTRNLTDYETLETLCVERKLKLYEYRDSRYIDLQLKGERLMGGIKAVFAKEDAKEILAKTMDGLKESWDAGLRVHTKTYGYDSSTFNPETGNKVWKKVEKEADIIRFAVEHYLAGEGVRHIAKTLNDKGYRWRGGKHFSHYEVDLMVTKPIYAGLTTDSLGREKESNLYPLIITLDQWRALEKMIPLRHKKGRDGRAIQHPLTSVLRCASCGMIYEFAPQTKKQLYYYRHKGPKPKECNGRGMVTEDGAEYIAFEAYVWGILNMTDSTFAEIKARLLNPDAESDIKRFDGLIEAVEKKIVSNQAALDLGDNVPYYAKRISEALSDLEQLQKQKQKIIHTNEESFQKYREALQAYGQENLKEFFKNKNGRFRNGKLKSLIKAIWLPRGDEFTVEYLDGRKRTTKYVPHVSKDALDAVNVIAMEEWDDNMWEIFLKAKTTGTAAEMMSNEETTQEKMPRITAEMKSHKKSILGDLGIEA